LGINPLIIIGYIKSTLEIILKSNTANRPISKTAEEVQQPEDYESMLQKLEAEIREHIRVFKLLARTAIKAAYRKSTEQN
jgi:hypothetical protein